MKNSFRNDENGVPLVSSDDIEDKAEEVIKFFSKETLYEPGLTPLPSIIEGLKDKYSVPFDFETDLGETDDRKKILGSFRCSDRCISVDTALEMGSERWRFTFAHELGHLVFHRNLKLKVKKDTEASLEINEKKKTPLEWLEWQANSFASALLMPRESVHNCLVAFQKDQEIIRNVGRVFVEPNSQSIRDFNHLVSHLTIVFSVSRTVAEIRLKRLRLVIDRRNQDFKKLDTLFRKS